MQLSWVLSLLLALLFAFVLLLFFCFYSKWWSCKLWKTYFFYSRNRFHVALRLFSNRSQMTSTCVTNKKWYRRCSRGCHWCCYRIKSFTIQVLGLSILSLLKKKKHYHPKRKQAHTVVSSAAIKFDPHSNVVIPRTRDYSEPASPQRHLQFVSHHRSCVCVPYKYLPKQGKNRQRWYNKEKFLFGLII